MIAADGHPKAVAEDQEALAVFRFHTLDSFAGHPPGSMHLHAVVLAQFPDGVD